MAKFPGALYYDSVDFCFCYKFDNNDTLIQGKKQETTFVFMKYHYTSEQDLFFKDKVLKIENIKYCRRKSYFLKHFLLILLFGAIKIVITLSG